jgi:signal transduction histidine kinase
MGTENSAETAPYAPQTVPWRERTWRPHWASLSFKSETQRALPVVVPVGVAGIVGTVVAIVALAHDPPSAAGFAGIAALLIASTAAEAFPLPIEGVTAGATSLSIVFLVGTAVIYGWAAAAVVGFLSMALVELGRRRPLTRIAFNTGLYVCGALAAGAVASIEARKIDAVVGIAAASSAAFYVENMVLLAAVIARVREMPFPRSLGRYVWSTLLPFLVLTSLSVTIVVLWNQSAFLALLVVGPLVMIALYERWLHGALERLREFDRLKDEFIAVISHELRTPLTSVYGAALTLQRHQVRDEMRESLLAIVSQEAGRLARLLDDALSASRLHAQTEQFHSSPIDAGESVRSVADATRSRLSERFRLDVAAPADLPLVQADPDKVRQVLVNLIENAIKYSPDGGTINVSVEPVDSVVRFTVRDEGIGIPKRAQEHVFERFHRVDPNMSRGVGGTGLGLYICREIVEHMNGRIWVASEEGIGSTFTFELPVATFAG